MYDFDTVVSRWGTGSMKFDGILDKGYPEDILSMWIADMDFKTPPCVLEALQKTLDYGILGYTFIGDDYVKALQKWYKERFDWQVDARWLTTTPGGDFALAAAVRALTEPGDGVLMQPPVYYPFYQTVEKNDRVVVESPLVYENGSYRIDFADLEQKIRDNGIKLMFLCSPHNPACRVWKDWELKRLGEICKAYGVTVVCDELHCDFAFPEHPHTPFLKACPEMAEQTVVCTSPSKTFNLAGLQVTNIWIPGEALRAKFQDQVDRTFYRRPSQMTIAATTAAYTNGGPWLDECKAYMRENLEYVRQYLQAHVPQIRLVEPEGTYFAWLDCTGLGLSAQELENFFTYKARILLDPGSVFGKCAEQFQRVVLACPKAVVVEAMDRIGKAARELCAKA